MTEVSKRRIRAAKGEFKTGNANKDCKENRAQRAGAFAYRFSDWNARCVCVLWIIEVIDSRGR